MRFIITGSGGCVSIPKALCQCKICAEARDKGYPYARCICSLYLEDISLLIDTPEDINNALNNTRITSVDAIAYSHWDPDHTLGMRVVEQLRLEWLEFFEDKKPENPITVYASKGVMEDINGIKNVYGSYFEYYENMNLIKRQTVDNNIQIKDIRITFIPVPSEKNVTVFLFEQNEKKLLYAPCDCLEFPEDKKIENVDILIIGNVFTGDLLKNNTLIHEKHPLRKEFHSIENVIKIKNQYNFNKVIVTHLEEFDGKSYDDYRMLEKRYQGIYFAYDGMKIEI